MTTRAPLVLGILCALALAACTGGDDDGMMTGTDAGTPPGEDAGTMGTPDARDPGLPSCDYPPGPYGSNVLRPLEPFTLPTCAGEDYNFYNQEFCDSSLTVISIAAGWCGPCMYESMNMTAMVTEPYRDRGVRVIQVIVQDADYNAATGAYCQSWVDRFGLTNIELTDAAGLTQIYFPGGSLPSTIIVDHDGIIRFRENGATKGLVSLRAKLDELLAEMGR